MTRWKTVLATALLTGGAATAGAATDGAATDGDQPSGELRPGQVVHLAGTGALGSSPDGTPALESELHDEMGIAVDSSGTVYLADTTDDRVRLVGTDGLLASIPEFSGGEPADGGRYNHLWAVAAGVDGSIYGAFDDGLRVLRSDGVVETIAPGQFIAQDIAVGADGTVYVADLPNSRIRAIDPAGTVTTIAGDDGTVDEPRSIAVDSAGLVYFTDIDDGGSDPSVVRRIDRDGTVSTVVGEEDAGFAGDGGPAAQAQVSDTIGGLAVGADDTLYLADTGNDVVRAVDSEGVIATVSPTLPTDALADAPAIPEVEDVAVGPDGRLYVAMGGTVQMIVPGVAAAVIGDADGQDDSQDSGEDPWANEKPGTVRTVVGAEGEVERPSRVAVDAAGVVYVIEEETGGLLRIPVGGPPEPVRAGVDGAQVVDVHDVAPGAGGVVFVSVRGAVDAVYPDGARVRLAGGPPGFRRGFGDAAPVSEVALANWQLATGPAGLYVADLATTQVFALAPDGILTLAAGDVDPSPMGGIDVAEDGTVYVAENREDHVVEVDPSGRPQAVFAGNGESSWMNDEIGDGGPAVDAVLARPTDVAVDADGTAYVSSAHGIRRIDTEGDITTVLEREDGAEDDTPTSLDFDAHGNLYFTESQSGLVRVLVRPAEMRDPLVWVGLVAGLVVVAGLVIFVIWRRRNARTSTDRYTASGATTEPKGI